MGCRSLLQGILLTWRANLRLLRFLHCRRAVYCWATRGAQGTGESGANMEVLGPDLLGQTPLHLPPSQSRNRLLSHLSSPRPHNIASHFLLSTAGMVTLHTPWSCLRMEQKDRNYTLTPWCDLYQNINYSDEATGPKTRPKKCTNHHKNSEVKENKLGLAKMTHQTFTKQRHLSNLLGMRIF